MKIFNRIRLKKKQPTGERTPQLTAIQRQVLEMPGMAVGGLPYETYDRMQSDAMVQTALSLKKLGVLSAPFRILPAKDTPAARQKAAFVELAFYRMEGSVPTILFNAMDAFAKGWSIQELVWAHDNGRYWLQSVRPKDPQLFGLEVNSFGRIEGVKLRIPGEADMSLPRSKFVLFAHRPSYAAPKGQSDLDAAYGHFAAKQTLLAAWKLHLERFASPTVLGKFLRGMPAVERSDMLSTLTQLHKHTAIMYPEEVQIDTLGSRGEGTNAFMEAIDFHNREIARSILGQTLTTDEGRRVGSLALGKVHLQVLLLQLGAIRRQLADEVMTEQVIRPLVELNFGPGDIPKFEFEDTSADIFATGRVD